MKHPDDPDFDPYEDAELDLSWAIPLSAIDKKPLEFAWYPYVSRAGITLVEGEGDVGKSSLCADVAARWSREGEMPCDDSGKSSLSGKPKVLWLASEEDAARIARPKLEAAGADLNRVLVIDKPKFFKISNGESFDLSRHTPYLEQACERLGIGLVVLDALKSFISVKDDRSEPAVRAALEPLAQFCSDSDVTILGIRHWNKDSKMSAKSRGGGSGAYGNVVRSIVAIAGHPELADQRVLIPVKANNVPDQDKRSLAYRFVSWAEDPTYAHLEWIGVVDVSGADVSGLDEKPGRKSHLKGAVKNAIIQMLSEGPMESREAREELVRVTGASKGTIDKAISELRESGLLDFPRKGFAKDSTVFWTVKEGTSR